MPTHSAPSSPGTTRLLAIDWGTTSARAYALDTQGRIVSQRSEPLGIQRMKEGDFAASLTTLSAGTPDTVPVLACGMIGSRQGWLEAPYRHCPAGLDEIAAGITPVPGSRLSIVPGLMHNERGGAPDVMRGEETQILGTVDDDALHVVVLPGTHSKWAAVERGAIREFRTYMTGELFAVLREHSILGRMMDEHGAHEDRAAFERGTAWSLRNEAALTHDLFSARTLPLTGALASSAVGDYLSGLLVGAEIAAARHWMDHHAPRGAAVTLVGDAALCARYLAALRVAGIGAALGIEHASATGLWRLANRAGLVKS
ncbi:MAG: 2-dehydro-3-deoxygalactonokinase [Betaproteobacteria bacterium]